MELKKVATEKAPAAIGPYSQAVICGNMVFTSGQIPINPANGLVEAQTITEQAEQVMKNIGAVLEAAGCTYANIVKTTIFASDINDFAAINGVYGKYFQVNPPARSFVQVAALPKGVHVEIEVVAVK